MIINTSIAVERKPPFYKEVILQFSAIMAPDYSLCYRYFTIERNIVFLLRGPSGLEPKKWVIFRN